MKFGTIKKIVLFAVLLPFVIMVAEGVQLIHISFQQYKTFRNDQRVAELLARGGAIVSTEIPAEMAAAQAYIVAPNPETQAAFASARKAVDEARRQFFSHLPPQSELSSGQNDEISKLSAGYSRIVALRSAVDDGRYGPNVDASYVYRWAALKQLGIGDSLSSLIHDPLLLRKSSELMSVLLTYHGETIIEDVGSHYLDQNGLSSMSRDQLVQAEITRRIGTDRLRYHTSSAIIRGILAFMDQPSERRADVYTQAILSGVLKPTLGLRDSWFVAQQGRLAFLRNNILAVTSDLRQTGKALSARAHYHLLTVILLSVGLAIFVSVIGGLAVKGMRLLDRLTREREELVHELRSASQTDLLTGLYNRRGFEEATTALLANSRPRWISVVLFDLDHFKKINDLHGHDVGDTVLKQVADIAKRSFRGFDLLVRHGGEEFLALLPDTTKEEAATIAERVRAAVEAAAIPRAGGGFITITASFGCVAKPQAGKGDIEGLIKKADMALYAAKAGGRNQVATSGIVSKPATERRQSKPA